MTKVRVGGRRTWWVLTAFISALGAVEVAAVALLGHRFLPATPARLLDLLGMAVLVTVVFCVASVTWRPHLVYEDRVRLVLGHLGAMTVSRDDILEVVELPPLTPLESDRTGPTFIEGTLNLVAAQGICRIHIRMRQPQRGRRLWQRRLVTVVEAGDPERLIAEALRTPDN
jgi:hypothetical protein